MLTTPEELLDARYDSALAEQPGRADAAKLVTTFAAAIAATLASPALEDDSVSPVLQAWTVAALASAGMLAIVVVLADRIRQPDLDAAASAALIAGMDPVDALRLETTAVVQFNEDQIGLMRKVACAQLVAATASSALSIVSLLG